MTDEFNVHVAKAMEEVNVRNARSIVEYSKATRGLVDDLISRFNTLEGQLQQRDLEIDQLKQKVVALQVVNAKRDAVNVT